MTYNTTAIILRRETFREADLAVTLLSRECGKIRAVAIGAKKAQSKLAGQLEPLRELRMMLAQGRHFDKIGQAVVRENFGLYHNSRVAGLWLGQKAADLVSRILPERQRETEVYELLREYLFLNSQTQSENIFLFFTLKLLALAGYHPELKNCLLCKKPLQPDNNLFNLAQGGAICPVCIKEVKGENLPISREAIKVWRWAEANEFKQSLKIKISTTLKTELDGLVGGFLKYHIF